MSKKTYIVESYDPATRKIERVTVTHEVYNAYRRSGWNIADNNQSFFKHEIQMSSLIMTISENSSATLKQWTMPLPRGCSWRPFTKHWTN